MYLLGLLVNSFEIKIKKTLSSLIYLKKNLNNITMIAQHSHSHNYQGID